MTTNLSERMRRASKLAALRSKLLSHLDYLQTKIGALTPLKAITKKLLAGEVSSDWFVQRLIDSGYAMADALKEFNLLRHSPEGKEIEQLKEGAIISKPTPYYKPVHRNKNHSPKEADLSIDNGANTKCQTCRG